MGYVDPREPDPQFPDRPTHPDYFLLSEVAQGCDTRSESGTSLGTIVGVDRASMVYFIRGRLEILAKAAERIGYTVDPDNAMTQAMYLDAFTVGKTFAEARLRDA